MKKAKHKHLKFHYGQLVTKRPTLFQIKSKYPSTMSNDIFEHIFTIICRYF